MQNIEIKSGTSAKISITPKINGVDATAEQLAGVSIYVFFVRQFTNKVYGEPKELTLGTGYTINLTPEDTVSMLGSASENQTFEMQFAIKTADGNVIAEDNSSVVINIIRWEAGQWLNQELTKSE